VKYDWFAAANKPEDIPAGIEMSVTPDKDESLNDMRDSNLLLSPDLNGVEIIKDSPAQDFTPSPNKTERETTERISDIFENMKNLFG
jgi:hypothetical protein